MIVMVILFLKLLGMKIIGMDAIIVEKNWKWIHIIMYLLKVKLILNVE